MRFKEWTASPAVIFDDEYSASTSFTMIGQAVTVTASFEAIPPTVTDVIVTPTAVTVEKGTTYQFSATVTGTNNPRQTVTWSVSGNNEAGTVIAADGTLTISGNETAETLTVRATSDLTGYTSIFGEATVTVTDIPAPLPTVTGVTVTPETITLNKGDIHTFSAAVRGDNNPAQGVTWSVEGGVSGTTITSGGALTVSVDETADIITVRAASTISGYTDKSGTATVTVTQPVSSFIPVTDITEVPASATAGTPLSLTGTVSPADATNQTITWSVKSENGTGATITGNIFSAASAGTAVITATVVNGLTDTTDYTKDFNITVSAGSIQTYALTINAGTGGSITTGASGRYAQGAVINITARANSGYTFNRWTSSNGGSFGNANSASTTFTMPANDAAITASFTYTGGSGGGTGGGGGGGGGTTPATTDTQDTKDTHETDIGGKTVTTPDGQPPVTDNDGNTTLPGGGTIKTESGAIIDAPAGTTIDKNGNITIPSGKEAEITLPGGGEITIPGGSTISGDGRITVGGGATITSGDMTLNITEGAILILDDDVPMGYFVSFENPFIDVKESDWFYDYVMFVYTHGLFSGTSATTFSPGGSMTRAMFATVLSRLDGADLSGYTATRFSDVPLGQWYTTAVEWAADKGIVNGIGNGLYDPNAPITREQMAVMLHNYLKYKGYTVPSGTAPAFADEDSISSWALEAVRAIRSMSIVSGRPGNLFDPQATATRAEVATIFAQYVESVADMSVTRNAAAASN